MKIEKQTELYEPYIYGNEKKYLNECISRNELTFGKFSKEFPKKISKLTKCKYPLQVQNGTSALYLCLRAVNIKKNDEIIVPSITFIASINVVNYCNAHPIFMDVDDTCNTNPSSAFPTDRSNVQCLGLSNLANANNATECAKLCCSNKYCAVWQYSKSQGCWAGAGELFSYQLS